MSDIRTSLGVADKRQSAYPSRFEIMPTMELMAGVLSQTSDTIPWSERPRERVFPGIEPFHGTVSGPPRHPHH